MSSRRRTNPPPESMAGMFSCDERSREERSASALLGVVGLGVGNLGFGLSGLGLLDRGVFNLDILDRRLSRNLFSDSLFGHSLVSLRSRLGWRGLLRRCRATGTVGLVGPRLLPHQLADGHRGVVALAR